MNERVTPGITPEEGVDFLVNRYFQGYNRNCSILYKQTVGIVCQFPGLRPLPFATIKANV
jgi:hypothetical protein